MVKEEPKVSKTDNERFGFSFYVNNHIICERIFDIYDYNDKCINSLEIKQLIDTIAESGPNGMGIIPRHLKQKSIEYLWQYYNPYAEQTPGVYYGPVRKGDVFKFVLKIKNAYTLKHKNGEENRDYTITSTFPNDFFTLQEDVGVDIKDVIKQITKEIRKGLSKKQYTPIN